MHIHTPMIMTRVPAPLLEAFNAEALSCVAILDWALTVKDCLRLCLCNWTGPCTMPCSSTLRNCADKYVLARSTSYTVRAMAHLPSPATCSCRSHS